MGSRRKASLHFNLPDQDAYTGGKNVVFHREHRTKKGRTKGSRTKYSHKEIIELHQNKIEGKRFKRKLYEITLQSFYKK